MLTVFVLKKISGVMKLTIAVITKICLMHNLEVMGFSVYQTRRKSSPDLDFAPAESGLLDFLQGRGE